MATFVAAPCEGLAVLRQRDDGGRSLLNGQHWRTAARAPPPTPLGRIVDQEEREPFIQRRGHPPRKRRRARRRRDERHLFTRLASRISLHLHLELLERQIGSMEAASLRHSLPDP